jgi:hypothetical protein
LLALALTTSGCRTPGNGSALLDTQVLDYEDDLGMRPGVGREGVLGDIRGECIAHDGMEATGSAQEATYSIQLIEKHQDLIRQLDVAAGTQIRAINPGLGLAASRKTKLAVGTAFGINRYSLYLLVSARIRNQTVFIKNARLADQARALLANSSEANLAQFREQCGDSFLSGSATGGEFIALIEIQTDTEGQSSEMRARFRQATGEPGAAQTEATLTAALRSLAAGRRLRVWVHQRGGAGEAEIGLPDSVDDIMKRLGQLADSTRAGQNPRALTATFSDYTTLGVAFPPSYQSKLDAAQEAIGRMSAQLPKLLDLGADIDYVLAHQESFVGIDAPLLQGLQQAQDAIAEKTRRIDVAGKRCQRDLTACAVPPDLEPPQVDLPQRRSHPPTSRAEHIEITANVQRASAPADLWGSTEYYLELRAARGGTINFVTLARTASEPAGDGWRGLSASLSVPRSTLADVYARLGISPEEGWLEVSLWEDDVYSDDLIGRLRIPFRRLATEGTLTRSLTDEKLDLHVTVKAKR